LLNEGVSKGGWSRQTLPMHRGVAQAALHLPVPEVVTAFEAGHPQQAKGLFERMPEIFAVVKGRLVRRSGGLGWIQYKIHINKSSFDGLN